MKVLTCASYYGSGSSAITDLVGEYDNVQDLSSFEIRIAHQLDGLSDLEYHLVDNHNRMNSGHAIKRFIKLAHFLNGNIISPLYSQFFGGKEFERITVNYIESLLDFKYPGWQFYDLYDKGTFSYYFIQIFNHLYQKTNIQLFRILKNNEMYCSHPNRELFLQKTQRYTHEIFEKLNTQRKEYLEIDQLVSSSNIDRILRYFSDETFVFIVDRDPRDIYLLGKYYWKDGICPSDPDLFCKWFLYARKSNADYDIRNPHICKIQFEDIVYKYDSTVHKIESMTGLDPSKHTAKFSRMNPKKSVVNTRLWEKFKEDEGIKIIEKQLSEYLYDYTNVDTTNILGIEVDNISNF